MVRCSVLGCKSDSSRKIFGLTFHKFPLNRIVQKHWITATGRKGWVPNDTSRICGKHFDDSHIIRKGKQRCIRPGAVPFMNEDKKPVETEEQIIKETILPITLIKNPDNSPLKNLRICCMNLPSTSSGPEITGRHYSFAENPVNTEASVQLGEQQCDVAKYDEKDLCCCCLREPSGVPLYSSVGRGTTERYADMLQECFGITIDASLRAHATICMECIIQVTEGAKFKRHMLQCHSAILNASEPVQFKQEAAADMKRESENDFAVANERQTNLLNQTRDTPGEHNTYLPEDKRLLPGGVILKEGSSDTTKVKIDEQVKSDDRFLQIGCRCPLDCVSNFRHSDIRSFKMLCKQLNEYCVHNTNHLDIFLLGALACLYRKDPSVPASNQKSETTVGYRFEGTDVCHDFFLYTYNVQKKQYDSVFKRIVGLTRGFVGESDSNPLHTELDIKEEVIEWG